MFLLSLEEKFALRQTGKANFKKYVLEHLKRKYRHSSCVRFVRGLIFTKTLAIVVHICAKN